LFLAYEDESQFRIVAADGPMAGVSFGTAEQVLFSQFEFNPEQYPGALLVGRIKAVWGLALDLDLSLNAITVHELGLGRPFRLLSFPSWAFVWGQAADAVMARRDGAKLKGPGLWLHLWAGSCPFVQ
jgi:hypothetical protein